jgi:hypothetical protein
MSRRKTAAVADCWPSLPSRKISNFPRTGYLGLKTLGAYRTPCECGQVYVGQTSQHIATKVKENYRHIRLGHPDKSARAERRFNHNQRIHRQNNKILSANRGIWTSLSGRPLSTNRKDGLILSGSWKPLICSLTKRKPASTEWLICPLSFSRQKYVSFPSSSNPLFSYALALRYSRVTSYLGSSIYDLSLLTPPVIHLFPFVSAAILLPFLFSFSPL